MAQARFWAKTGQGDLRENGEPKYHPVICHLADTAAVAMEIMSLLSPVTRQTLEDGLGLSGEALTRWCGFLAGCHDLGKISPAFQFKVSEVAQALAGGELYDLWHKIPLKNQNSPAHGLVTAKTLPEYLIEKKIKTSLAHRLASLVGGHHGFFPTLSELQTVNDELAGLDDDRWLMNDRNIWRAFTKSTFEDLWQFTELSQETIPKKCDNPAAMILAGLTTVSDWIASNCDDNQGFPYADDQSFQDYTKDLKDKAKRALNAIGWTKFQHGKPLSFTELFKDIKVPRELQKSAIAATQTLTTPCFVLFEASMGEGKTEAALLLADYLQQQLGVGGFYVGLPTQATSNAMYQRVKDHLEKRHRKDDIELINLTLSHSAAALKTEYLESTCRLDQEKQIYDEDKRVVVREWHTARKRSLLSPYGVGTLDQALMGAIKSKHQFVRLFGLAGRTVIMDEIHAYDLYTNTLLQRFLEWLAALGSPVIALSATLPYQTRKALLEVYARGAGFGEVKMNSVEYPRMTTLTHKGLEIQHFSASQHVTRSLHIQWKDDQQWIACLKAALAEGGCAAVICSTVGRAQSIFRQLADTFDVSELGLFHGRFLFADREKIEKDCRVKFGKPEDPETVRPPKFVLVATQVVEQSLDLDFDLMISDLAPIDLLLQRSGRLHRHEKRNLDRPTQLKKPALWLIKPKIQGNGLPDFQEAGFIYDRYILLRTWLITRNLKTLELPEMMDDLIEAVYAPDATESENLEPHLVQDLQDSWTAYQEDANVKSTKADSIKLPKPSGKTRNPEEFTQRGESDDANTIAAVTRLGQPSITVVFLKKNSDGLILPRRNMPVVIHQEPDFEMTRSLLAHSTRISKRGLVDAIMTLERPESWRSMLLKYCRYVELDENLKAQVGKWQLTLDENLGVLIEKL